MATMASNRALPAIAVDPTNKPYFDAARELATRGDFQPHPTTGPIGVSPEVAAQFDKAQNTGQDGD